jgi:hypothetical protein
MQLQIRGASQIRRVGIKLGISANFLPLLLISSGVDIKNDSQATFGFSKVG